MSAEPYIYFDGCENCAYNAHCIDFKNGVENLDCPEDMVLRFMGDQKCKKLY